MKIALFRISGFLLQLAACLLLLVACVAILYPAVLTAGAVIIVLAMVLMALHPRPESNDSDSKPTLRLRMLAQTGTRWAWRALWVAVIAMVFSFSLMVFLKSVSWVFYINPLDRELEPYRQLFRTHEKSRSNSGAERVGQAERLLQPLDMDLEQTETEQAAPGSDQ